MNSRVLIKLEELAQSQTVILDDLAIVKAVLLLIRTFLPEDDAAQLFWSQIFDEKNRILQQSWILICILNNFCKDTIFSHYFANSIFGCSLLTLHSQLYNSFRAG